jgi:hypothetical protein
VIGSFSQQIAHDFHFHDQILLLFVTACWCEGGQEGGEGEGGDETATGARTVASVCDSSRSKSVFCKNDNNCNANGIIVRKSWKIFLTETEFLFTNSFAMATALAILWPVLKHKSIAQ